MAEQSVLIFHTTDKSHKRNFTQGLTLGMLLL